jgi:hypothetical protein
MDRWGLLTTQVYALKSGVWLCRQKFTQDFSFKIHLLLQNVLQNLVRFNSKSVLCRKMFAQDFSFKILFFFFKTLYKNLVRSTSKSVTSSQVLLLFLKSSHILVYLVGITLQVSPPSLEPKILYDILKYCMIS